MPSWPLVKLVKLSEDTEGIAFPSTSRILLPTYYSFPANSRHDAPGPPGVVAWQPSLASAQGLLRLALSSIPALTPQAGLDLSSDTPGPLTLFFQVCMSQGSWDLWVLKHPRLDHPHPQPMTTPPPLPLMDLDLQPALQAARQLEV